MNSLELQGRLLLPNKDTLPLPFHRPRQGGMKGASPCKAMGNICSVWWAKQTRRRWS